MARQNDNTRSNGTDDVTNKTCTQVDKIYIIEQRNTKHVKHVTHHIDIQKGRK